MSATSSMRLLVRGVSKSFDGMSCLNTADMQVSSGQLVVVTGANGSGKTTLLNIVSGWTRPDEGEVVFDSSPGKLGSPEWFASRGMVRCFQKVRSFEQMPIRDCMMAAAYGGTVPGLLPTWLARRRLAKLEEQQSERVTRLLGRLGWQDKSGTLAGELSYGQRKLLALAQVLLAPASFIVLDEPLAGIDERQAQIAVALVSEWKHAHGGRAGVVVAHETEFLQPMADATMRLANGRLSHISQVG